MFFAVGVVEYYIKAMFSLSQKFIVYGHCIICLSLLYGFSLQIWYRIAFLKINITFLCIFFIICFYLLSILFIICFKINIQIQYYWCIRFYSCKTIHNLLIFPEHLSSPPVFSGVCVTRSLVLCVCFVDRCLSFFFWPLCCFSFDLRILITHSVFFYIHKEKTKK